MAITVVQFAQHVNTTGTTATTTFASAVTKGNLVVLGYAWGSLVNPTSANQETWNLNIGAQNNATVGAEAFAYAFNATGGWTVCTLTWAAANGSCHFVAWEIAGALYFDQAVTTSAISGNTSTTMTAGPTTPASSNNIFLAGGNNNGAYVSGPSNGYTDDSHAANLWGHLISTDALAHSTVWTKGAGDFLAAQLNFAPPNAAPVRITPLALSPQIFTRPITLPPEPPIAPPVVPTLAWPFVSNTLPQLNLISRSFLPPQPPIVAVTVPNLAWIQIANLLPQPSPIPPHAFLPSQPSLIPTFPLLQVFNTRTLPIIQSRSFLPSQPPIVPSGPTQPNYIMMPRGAERVTDETPSNILRLLGD